MPSGDHQPAHGSEKVGEANECVHECVTPYWNKSGAADNTNLYSISIVATCIACASLMPWFMGGACKQVWQKKQKAFLGG